jgi:hypothetical protein
MIRPFLVASALEIRSSIHRGFIARRYPSYCPAATGRLHDNLASRPPGSSEFNIRGSLLLVRASELPKAGRSILISRSLGPHL